MQPQPPTRHSKGFIHGLRVRVMPGTDQKRAQPAGTIVAVREVAGRRAYTVRHDCGRLRTWRSADLSQEAGRPPRGVRA